MMSLQSRQCQPSLFCDQAVPPPFIAVQMVVSKMLVYPNELAVPVMPNFGAPPPPLGMLHVKVRPGGP